MYVYMYAYIYLYTYTYACISMHTYTDMLIERPPQRLEKVLYFPNLSQRQISLLGPDLRRVNRERLRVKG